MRETFIHWNVDTDTRALTEGLAPYAPGIRVTRVANESGVLHIWRNAGPSLTLIRPWAKEPSIILRWTLKLERIPFLWRPRFGFRKNADPEYGNVWFKWLGGYILFALEKNP